MPQRHLLHIFSTFATGGPQVRFSQVANHFGDRYRHTLLAMDGDYACRERIDAAIMLEIPPVGEIKKRLLANILPYRRTLIKIKPDLLVTYNWGTVEWALANRWRPICRHMHLEDGFGPEEATRQLQRRIWLRRLALTGRHTAVVVPSRTLLEIATTIWRLPSRSVRLIPNGIDCDRFARVDSVAGDRSFARAEDEIVVGTVASLRTEKNIGRLIRAFAAVSAGLKSRLLIVGGGTELPHLQQIATTCGVRERVVFTGGVDKPELMLAKFDVFALSSDTEQMPLSVIEAMAAGRPIASVDVGDVRQMVAAENRPFIVATLDENDFRRALYTLMTDAEARRRLGQANRVAAYQRFDHDRMFAAYAELFG